MKKLNNHATIPANNTRFLYSSRSNSIQYHKLFHTFHVKVFSPKRYWMLWILQVKQYRYLGAESKIRCVRWASLLGTASVSSVNIYKSLNHCAYWVHVIHMFIWCLYARQYNAPINEYTGRLQLLKKEVTCLTLTCTSNWKINSIIPSNQPTPSPWLSPSDQYCHQNFCRLNSRCPPPRNSNGGVMIMKGFFHKVFQKDVEQCGQK